MKRAFAAFFCVLALAGCGGEPEQRTRSAHDARAEAEREPARPPNTLYRDEVDAAVDVGLGAFLRHVEVEPSLDAGRFVGFRLVALWPDEFWSGVDLRPGDVVTRVNGMPIERETQAYNAFQSLKQARALRVSYLRGGVQRELVMNIVERPGAKSKSSQPPKPAAATIPEAPEAKPAAPPEVKPDSASAQDKPSQVAPAKDEPAKGKSPKK